MAIKDYNVDPDLNVQISGINIAEGCPPSGINNAIRQLMADVKAEQDVRGEEWAFQSAKDAAQDEAISAAQSSADAAQSSADAAQSSADAAKSSADAAKNSVPTGTVIAFAANSEPPGGFLLCNGAAVSRTTYAKLFEVIGTTYGAGDGASTFTLPNLTDRFIQGSGMAGSARAAGVPNISGAVNMVAMPANSVATGPFYTEGQYSLTVWSNGSAAYSKDLWFNANRQNAIYGASNTVQPPALTMRYYIKY